LKSEKTPPALQVVEVIDDCNRPVVDEVFGPLDLLPMLRRTAIAADANAAVSVLAVADPGLFLVDPHIHLDPGRYHLEIRCRGIRGEDAAAPLITVEVAAGATVVTEATFTAKR
jgi:hypothetical protein